ncbi:MAG: circularly permuted type 2 ATP-grasp protein [Treponema sp.]|nr:circularly permuted type 2 ATP-grasp protein [Treponema sp.]
MEILLQHLIGNAGLINEQLARYGVKFGIYKNGIFNERLFPFDPIPRIISSKDWQQLSEGLAQRVIALNLFLSDIYSKKQIIADGVVPEDFVFSSSGYLAQCEGIFPAHGIYSHISGIDLVQAKDGSWFVLEDNLRIPSGASYPLIVRGLSRKCSPDTFVQNHIVDNRNYGIMLKDVFDDMNRGGINVIYTPGRYNAAYFEHAYLAEQTDSVLAQPGDLFVENNVAYCKTFGGKERVGAIYRRISDDYLDPLTFLSESLIGIPGIMDAYRAGNIALINAPGNGVADDKGIYYFVPKMIQYYLKQEPILRNAPTYLPFYEEDKSYVLANLKKLVIKDVAEAGGYGVLFGRDMDNEKLSEMAELIKTQPRRWIAQEVIDFKDLPIMDEGKQVERKADLRAFVLYGKTVQVWPSGLTRFSRNSSSFIVNSSQGGGFKDTWVLVPEHNA